MLTGEKVNQIGAQRYHILEAAQSPQLNSICMESLHIDCHVRYSMPFFKQIVLPDDNECVSKRFGFFGFLFRHCKIDMLCLLRRRHLELGIEN
jgi:hypothetical protein